MKRLRELDRGRPRGAPLAARHGRPCRLSPAARPNADDGQAMTRRAPRRHDHHRHVRGRSVRRGRRARGSRLLRDRQPAARAHPEGRRARRAATESADPLRARRRRALRRVHGRARRRARRAARHGRARTRMLFLDAADDVLVRRFEATRRQHPLAATDRVSDGIARERALLEELKGEADVVVDTSNLNVHELRDRLRELFADARRPTARCRPASCRSATSTGSRSTSTWSSTAASCRTRTGSRAPAAARHRSGGAQLRARAAGGAAASSPSWSGLFALLLPAYVREGKSYLSIGVGCTGGRHRSVVDRRGARRSVLAAARLHGRACTTATSTVADARPPRSSRSAAGTAWPSRCAPRPRYAGAVTAVVSVADDGGSSGRLRRDLDVPPPGDIRRCLVALAGDEGLWSARVRAPLPRG